MYTLIRKIHLYAGFIILMFLLMYFVTGYVIIHRRWFTNPAAKPQVTTQTQSLATFTGHKIPEELASFIAQQNNIHGRLTLPLNPPDFGQPLTFSIINPGATTQVELPADGSQLTLKTSHNDLAAILVQLHRIHGYGGGVLFNTWVFLNDLASFSCILFALTGVYLWWKSTRNHFWGILCLTTSCTYGLAMILYLLLAR